MIWHRVTDLCIESGAWRIFRYPMGDPEYFELWCWPKFIGRFDTSEQAKGSALSGAKQSAGG